MVRLADDRACSVVRTTAVPEKRLDRDEGRCWYVAHLLLPGIEAKTPIIRYGASGGRLQCGGIVDAELRVQEYAGDDSRCVGILSRVCIPRCAGSHESRRWRAPTRRGRSRGAGSDRRACKQGHSRRTHHVTRRLGSGWSALGAECAPASDHRPSHWRTCSIRFRHQGAGMDSPSQPRGDSSKTSTEAFAQKRSPAPCSL